MGQFMGFYPTLTRQPTIDGLTGQIERVIFAQVTTGTVGNTAVETTILNATSAVGSKTIPASYLLAGNYIKIYVTGTIATDALAVPAITLKAYYGATALSTLTFTPGTAVGAGTVFEYTGTIKVATAGASGSLVTGQLLQVIDTNVAFAVAPAAVSVDTTAAGAIDLKITWGTADADNTISAITGYIEVIG